MTDRPILFSAPMVRALLNGRKTQTRRIAMPANDIKKGPWTRVRQRDDGSWQVGVENFNVWQGLPIKFAAGDRLWVKETWRAGRGYDGARPRDMAPFSRIWFEADGCNDNADAIGSKARPSIFMPRWASRLTLTVTDVRVQRLHECSDVDAIAEGIEPDVRTDSGQFYRNYLNKACPVFPYGSYASLWDSINGSGAWDTNPWVVAVSFDVRKGNIDG